MAEQIRINDLFYIYESGGDQVVALRGLTLNISLGECLAIRGPNGSGKSTLVKILTGFQTPTTGEIFIDEVNLQEIDPIKLRREFVASVDQSGNLIKELTILANLELAHSLNGKSLSLSRELSLQTLLDHQLSHLTFKYPEEISSSERQYLSILAALATDPQVLIADEPSAELDDAGADAIYSLLNSLSQSRIVALVTHDPRAERFATRTVRIREGRISEAWSAGESEQSVVDQFGWMRVKEVVAPAPERERVASRSQSEPIVKVSGLSLTYGEKKIFSELTFSAAPGELVVLDSSRQAKSGRSSLLRILAGLQSSTTGSVELAGELLSKLDREGKVKLRAESLGYLPQRGQGLARITLGEYLGSLKVDLGASLNGRRDTSLGNFSGGERARIETSKLIAEARPILLLDEPTSQMDDRRSHEVIGELFSYLAHGGVAIISTRNELLIEAADQLLELRRDG
jgi:ABC-type lipoprotein export system ATPase subunit